MHASLVPNNRTKMLDIARRHELTRGFKSPKAEKEPDSYSIGKPLLNALYEARDKRHEIPLEVAKLQRLLDKDIASGEKSEEWIEGRKYQIWLLELQLTRAADLAELRLDYLQKIRTKEDVERELELCKNDQVHWFKYYAWGHDPRTDAPLNIVPFELFEFQERFVEWLDMMVFDTRQSGIVPKSRDMGATETGVRWGLHKWLFRAGFEMLLLSRIEDLVDSGKDMGTLFEKVRHQMRLLPEWMLPKGFSLEKDMPYMRITNPVNGSTFHGLAPTKSVGRQHRVTVVWFDEFAFVDGGGWLQSTSLSQTSKSLIYVSSVAGKLNKFGELVEDKDVPQFVMDWREHPFKTERWYNALGTGVFGPKMTAQMIAQEIDRDLDASQPGKVWKYQEQFLFMTQREIVQAFAAFGQSGKFYDESGKFIIPRDWLWSRYSDYGQTTGHEWGYLIAARPSQMYPWNDTVFVFLALELKPTGLTENQAVRLWRGYEQAYGLRNAAEEFITRPFDSLISHEQKKLRETLEEVYGEEWSSWDTDYNTGISQAQSWMEIIDKLKPNPFRPELFGRCKIVFVAPDNQYECAFNKREGKYYVTTSKDELGFLTFRKQLSAYHYPETERGKDVKKMRPAKQFDDIIDPFRALAVNWGVPVKRKTEEEEIESRLPEHLKQNEIAAAYGQEGFGQMIVAREMEKSRARAVIQEERDADEALLRKNLNVKRVNLFGKRRK